jgi:hypothetical protein
MFPAFSVREAACVEGFFGVRWRAMIKVLVLYLVLGGVAFSFWHSYRLMGQARRPGATVNVILQAKREKGLLLVGGSLAFAYGLTILFLSIFWGFLTAYIVFTPLLYLLGWSLPRAFLRPQT